VIIKRIPIKDIKIAKYNPRKDLKPGDPEYDRIKKSVDEFGLVEPLVLNGKSNVLVGGHQRLKVLQERGDKTVDVVIVDLDPIREKALNIALNRISGEWDENKLYAILNEFKLENISIDMTGFSMDDFAELDVEYGTLSSGLTNDDSVPTDIKARCKSGDVWNMGKHYLLCGDCRKEGNVKRLFEDEKAVLMNTDPPYGDSWVKKAKDMQAHGYGHSRAVLHGSIESDHLVGDQLQSFLSEFMSVAKLIANSERPFVFYVWHRAKRKIFEDALIESGYFIHQPIVWVKPSMVIGRLNYHPSCEIAYHGWIKGNGKCPWYGDRGQTDVWPIGRENDKIHPTQKPVEIFVRPILNHTKKDEIVYEPFAGSGSQYIAAEKTGRRCYGIEISPHYCDVILQRWETYTGKKAKKIS
jgi:DNA modification methylase